jgi:signal peptidase II
LRYYIIAVVIILFDQITKWLVVKNMELGQSITVLENIFYITSHRNRGAAFGILQGQMWLFFIITAIVIVGVIYYMEKDAKGKSLLQTALAFILGGAIGNFIDRLFRGQVVDFIDVKVINYDYPIFNIADSALVVGVILISIQFLLESKSSKEKEHNGTSELNS